MYTQFTVAARPSPLPRTAVLTYGLGVLKAPHPSGPATHYTDAAYVGFHRLAGTWRSFDGGRPVAAVVQDTRVSRRHRALACAAPNWD